MEKFIYILKTTEFHVLLYCLGMLLFNWPVLTIFENARWAFFYYLFCVWGAFILVLFFIATNLLRQNGKDVDK